MLEMSNETASTFRGSIDDEGAEAETRGKKVSMDATPPIKVAIPNTIPSGDIPSFFFIAFCFGIFGLDFFSALFDIVTS